MNGIRFNDRIKFRGATVPVHSKYKITECAAASTNWFSIDRVGIVEPIKVAAIGVALLIMSMVSTETDPE
jgi:hypothetical protein